jgi:hypothetical protein
MIRYEWIKDNLIAVFLENKRIGKIIKHIGSDGVGYQYFPKGNNKGGDVFFTLYECKKSLEP